MNVTQRRDLSWHIAATLLLALAIALPRICSGQRPHAATSRDERSLTAFLRKYLTRPNFGIDTTTRIVSAQAGVGNAATIVIYVSGQSWCGSGGCTLLTLSHHDSTYRVIGRTSLVRLPIRMLQSETNGRHDLGVRVGGGGVQQRYEALLPFNGAMYPSNPTIPPTRRSGANASGQLLIRQSQRSHHLY